MQWESEPICLWRPLHCIQIKVVKVMQSCIVTWNHYNHFAPIHVLTIFNTSVRRFLGESESFSSQFWEISDSNNLSSPCLHRISDIEKPRIGIARFVESSIKGTESRHQPYLSGNNITAFAQSAPPADSAALGQKFFFCKRTDMAGRVWTGDRCMLFKWRNFPLTRSSY